MTFDQLLTRCREDVYPEPRSHGHDQITHKMLDMIKPMLKPRGAVLDIGCGQGNAIEWFNSNDFDCTGTTLSKSDLLLCESRKFNVIEWDMHRPNVWLHDFIFARHVLEHSPCPLLVLNNFHESLTDDGLCYIEMPYPGTSSHHEDNPNHYSVLTPEMWASLIHKAGFKIKQAWEHKITTMLGDDKYMAFLLTK